jgi:hypothetical protein
MSKNQEVDYEKEVITGWNFRYVVDQVREWIRDRPDTPVHKISMKQNSNTLEVRAVIYYFRS